MRYIEKTNKLIKDYFNILSPNYPEWLNEYIETERMLKQQYISVTCGKIYSKLFDYNDYSSLDHSIAVALIIWNFTHDKKQTLAGLFHDILFRQREEICISRKLYCFRLLKKNRFKVYRGY